MIRITLDRDDDQQAYSVTIERATFDGEPDATTRWFEYGNDVDRLTAFNLSREYFEGAKAALRSAGIRFGDNAESPLRELRNIQDASL